MNAHAILPADRFYWQVIDTARLGQMPRSRDARHRQLGYVFESVLPVPIEQIHTTYHRLNANEWLACGIDPETIQEHAHAVTLTPDAIPSCLALEDETPDPRSLNLLIGPYEPARIRALRRNLVTTASAAALIIALFASAGLMRRAGHHLRAADAARAAEHAVYDQVLGPSGSNVPAPARLTAEYRSLQMTRGNAQSETEDQDVLATLARFLSDWPDDVNTSTESLSVTPTAIVMRVRLPDSESAAEFERRLVAPDGWRLPQPQVQPDTQGVAMQIRMEPAL